MLFSEDEFNRGAFSTNSVGSNAGLDQAASMDQLPHTVEELPTVEALRYEHPDYEKYHSKWLKYLNLYESEKVYKYIHKHLREHESSHALRVKRGYFYNYVATVVDLFTAFLYRAPVIRTFPSKLGKKLDVFMKDVDRCGTDFTSFMAKVCAYSKLQGHNAILVDAPAASDALTEADDADIDLLPYLTHVYAHQILDWKLDIFGNFEWVKLRVNRPQERDWHHTVSDVYETYQIWDRMSWREYTVTERTDEQNEKIEQIERVKSGNHGLGQVPLVVVKTDKSSHPWFGSSVVRDIADINIAILNWSSMQDEEIFNRCLNILTMQRDEDSTPIEVSHYNAIEYPEGASPPSYLVPGATPLDQIRASIADARDEIRRLAKMNISTGFSDVRQASSGIAHAFQFIEANQNLANKSITLQNAELKLFKLVAKYIGEDFKGTEIEYAKEFGIEDYNMLLTEIAAMGETIESETAWKEAQKNFVRRRFNTAEPSLLQQMEKEIEEAEKPKPEDFGFPSGLVGGGTDPNQDTGSGESPELVENQSPEPGEDPGPVTKTE